MKIPKQSIQSAIAYVLAQTVGQPTPAQLALSTQPTEPNKRAHGSKNQSKAGKAKRKANKAQSKARKKNGKR